MRRTDLIRSIIYSPDSNVHGSGQEPFETASENTSGIDGDANLASYQANCQCGAIIFVFKAPAVHHCNVISCTCSICSKKGYLMVHSQRVSMVFQTGEDRLCSYFIKDENTCHKFCEICGSGILVDYPGCDNSAINVSVN